MADKQLLIQAQPFWISSEFWTVAGLIWLAIVAKVLKEVGPFNWRKFAVELIGGFLAAVAIFSYGLLNELAGAKLWLVTALVALGVVWTVEKALGLLATVKKVTP